MRVSKTVLAASAAGVVTLLAVVAIRGSWDRRRKRTREYKRLTRPAVDLRALLIGGPKLDDQAARALTEVEAGAAERAQVKACGAAGGGRPGRRAARRRRRGGIRPGWRGARLGAGQRAGAVDLHRRAVGLRE